MCTHSVPMEGLLDHPESQDILNLYKQRVAYGVALISIILDDYINNTHNNTHTKHNANDG